MLMLVAGATWSSAKTNEQIGVMWPLLPIARNRRGGSEFSFPMRNLDSSVFPRKKSGSLRDHKEPVETARSLSLIRLCRLLHDGAATAWFRRLRHRLRNRADRTPRTGEPDAAGRLENNNAQAAFSRGRWTVVCLRLSVAAGASRQRDLTARRSGRELHDATAVEAVLSCADDLINVCLRSE
jgi:hypothetical protein